MANSVPVPQKNNAAPAAANGATQPITGAAQVTMPDQNGSYHLNVAKAAVKRVEVADVDLVLQLNDGTNLVLAGGAMGAMDAKSQVIFTNNETQETGRLLDTVGKIPLQNHDQALILNSNPATTDSSNASDKTASDQSQVGQDSNAAHVVSTSVSLLNNVIQENTASVTSKSVQSSLVLPSTTTSSASSSATTGAEAQIKSLATALPERPGALPTPAELGPQEPSLTLKLLNLTTVTQVGSTLYGSGGSPASASDESNATQFATQVIHAGDDVHTIYATSSSVQTDFIKIIEVNILGDGVAQTLKISGVPSSMTILNATALGDGVYAITPTVNQKTFELQIKYSTAPADPAHPVGPISTLQFDTGLLTTSGLVNFSETHLVAIKDASNYTDLTYSDPVTGKNVWVLPAQGVPHEIHAGDGGVTIYGSNANDALYGGAGVDTLIGGSGNTYFEGGAGADIITGGTQGVNTAGYTNSAAGVTVDLSGSGLSIGGDAQGDILSNIQNLVGSAHDDTFIASAAHNALDGGSDGSDTVSYAASTQGVTVNLVSNLGSGGFAEGDTYTHIQNVIGSAHDDIFVANALVNHLDGGSGGSDTVSYAGSLAGVTVNLSTGLGSGGSADGDTYVHIQNVIGGAYNDTFVGNIEANHFDGGSGQNEVSYANSSVGVTVNFVTGAGSGGDASGDTYVNIQNVSGSAHDDVFVAGANSLVFDGGSGGMDSVDYSSSTSGVVVNMVSMTGSGGYAQNNSYANIQKIIGSSYADTFISGAGADFFDGAGGSNTVSYVSSNMSVAIDLSANTASGGYAQGDTLQNIQNLIGSAYDDRFVANVDSNRFDGGGGVNTVSYEASTGAVTVDLSNTAGLGTGNAFAAGDSFVNIQNLVGSSYDDIFIASNDANTFDGGTSTASSHNLVSYAASNAMVIVDLTSTNGSGTSGGYAAGDTLINIQDLTGSAFNDTFIASAAANNFDGGAGSNTVSYAGSAGVTVDLAHGIGSGGFAAGDTYVNIQNVNGSDNDDTFIANNVSNTFDGKGGSNTVSYAQATDNIGVLVNLLTSTGSNGFAAGDKYINIQNVIGSGSDDTFVASSDANIFDGGQGSDTVSYANLTDAVTVNLLTGVGTGGYAAGDHYSNIENVIGGAGNDSFIASAAANKFDGGGGTHNLVSYASSTNAVTVDLSTTIGTGSGDAVGDTYTNIQDIIGGAGNDIFIASAVANKFDGGGGTHNRVSYANSTAAVTVNLFNGIGSGDALFDTYTNIQDVSGGAGNDSFIANGVANNFDGGGGTHNLVSYANSTTAVTVDLSSGIGSGDAAGDTYTNIQDVTGGAGNDTFIASLAANNFIGNGGTHNLVSYANSTAAVTVNLAAGTGSGAWAAGDTYTNIQDVTGGTGDDTFIASTAANNFDGGISTVISHNLVSYANSTNAVTVDLFNGTGSGDAAGDTYTRIQDIIGGAGNDTLIASTAANNFDGGGGTHNLVSYINSTNAVTVDLSGGTGSGDAAGDTYIRIQDVTGGAGNDIFIASAVANNFIGGGGTHNLVSYANSTTAVTVNLFAGIGSGGDATGDTYTGIQDVTGGAGNDSFIANGVANNFDGGSGTHNLVSYANSANAVTVDLSSGIGSGDAAGDTYTNIQDVTGGAGNDSFIASLTANNFVGGGGTHNLVSYANSTAAVTVDLFGGTGSGGWAAGDTYNNIQDVVGSAADDVFIASAAANNFDGGTTTALSHNRVSYVNSTQAVTVDLSSGVGSGDAAGDTYIGIQDVTGGAGNDTFIANTVANNFNGGGGTHNLVSYVNSTQAVTVDLSTTIGTGSGGDAAGDTYTNIQDVTGGVGNDIFIASAAANKFDGGSGTHNRVSYANSTAALTVNLSTGIGNAGDALGDTYTNIQDITGGAGNDIFIASAVANNFDGGGGTHNVVSYANSTQTVTVDLFNGIGSGDAAGDTYTRIQDVIGGTGDDTFIANGSAVANNFDGGTSTASSHNRVSYANSTQAVTVDLSSGIGGGDAAGDTYIRIQDVTGGAGDDTFIASAAANNFDGGLSTALSHNRVSYANSTNAVTVNLSSAIGIGGGDAAGDTYINIQDITGGAGNDTFIANAVANNFDGGTSTASSHNLVSYANSSGAVTVDLFTGLGSSGDAAGDTYTRIQDITGSAGNDIFMASAAANKFDGGGGTHNLVSYVHSTASVTVDLSTTIGIGSGDAAGDTYTNIQDVTGGDGNDIFIAAGVAVANNFDGGAGTHNLVSYANSTQAVTVDLSTTIGTGGGDAAGDTYANIQDITGGTGNDSFIANAVANNFNGGGGLHNRVSYASSSAGVTVDLSTTIGTGSGGWAAGDTYSNIQDATGGTGDDTFIANGAANNFDGGISSTVSHNRVSYANSTAAITVDLSTTIGTGSLGDAAGDTYTNIQDVTGGAGNDIFIAGTAANNFNGGGGSHNRVNYANAGAGVTVDLSTTTTLGIGGSAAGDTYANIQDITGSTGFDDVFVASAAANTFDGGTGSSHNRVSYVNSTSAVTVDLINNVGSGDSNSYALGDVYSNIQDITGSAYNDIFIANAVANNFDGGGGTHNVVSYVNQTGAVTIDLSNGIGSRNWAAGDTYTNIQDVIGGAGNDIFVASLAANNFDGGGGTHNAVSYVNQTGAVTVDLFNGIGSRNWAAGDTYTNIQDVTGGADNDIFIASNAANVFIGGGGSHNSVSYINSSAAVTVDLFNGVGSGVGSSAAGDTYSSIQDVVGSLYDDVFIGNDSANNFDGSLGSLHNRVSYINSSLAVTVNLDSGLGSGGHAGADTYTNIQDATGSLLDDTFVGSAAANNFDGSGGTLHNQVSYNTSTAAVTVDLFQGTGTGGYAQGDTYANIQDVTGSVYDDIFYASAAANKFMGGVSTGTSHNRVSYAYSNVAETIDLFAGVGSGGTGSLANGDTYSNIQDVTGGAGNDTFIANNIANNFDGGGGSHNRVSYVNSTLAVAVDLSTTIGNGSSGYAAGDTYTNIQDVTGGAGNDTFFASAVANNFDGGGGTHNLVSYANQSGAVTVNLLPTIGTGTGGWAQDDTYANIQDVTGGLDNDTFIASSAANKFDGGGGSHNRVNYASSTAGVTVDLSSNITLGIGGLATGDTYNNIQDVTGSDGYDDIFVASAAANAFDGGTGSSHNRVSYANATTAVTIDLSTGVNSGAFALGDTYTNIQDFLGSGLDDIFIVGATASNFDGGSGSLHNRVSYAASTAAVTVDMINNIGTGGYAAGNTFVRIQDVTGSAYDDIFIASAAANSFDGGAGSNTVVYTNSSAAVTVNLSSGAAGIGGFALGDTYLNIQNISGSGYADTLTGATSGKSILLGAGGGDTLAGVVGNRGNTYASYDGSSSGVTINLTATDGSGTSGGDATGDRLSFIDNLIGSAFDDTFVANSQANIFNGGAGGNDTVSYAPSTSAVVVDLSNSTGAGTSGGYAQGDSFLNIKAVIGSAFNDTLKGAAGGLSVLTGGAGADDLTGIGSGNIASYALSSVGVTIDLKNGTGTGGDAQGDVLHNIYNVIGSTHNDTFLASLQSNNFVGNGGVDTVSYIYSTVGVAADLTSTTGSGTSGGYAAGDTFTDISNLIGSNYDDTFYASAIANAFDGGTGSNTVDYSRSVAAVVVDLYHHTGSDATSTASYAAGDTYINIQNAVGSSGNDIFYANSSANKFTGGGGIDTVSYENTNTHGTSPNDIIANLATGLGTSGDAAGDTYIGIANLTGSAYNNSSLTGDSHANTLVAMGTTTTNILSGGGADAGIDVLDARLGGSNTLIAGSGLNTFMVSAHNSQSIVNSNTGSANLVSANGSAGTTTLHFDDLGTTLDTSQFSSIVHGITTLDVSASNNTNVIIGSAQVRALGVNNTLTIQMHGNDSIQILSPASEHYRVFSSGDYVFYDTASFSNEIARIHTLAV